MKCQELLQMILVVTLLAASSSAAWGQQCPEWSATFDQIDDSAALQNLQSQRSQGWPNFNPANNGGASLQQSISQGEQLIQQYQEGIARDQQIWMETRSTASPMPNVTASQCRSMNGGAAMAAACDAHTNRNALLGIEGIMDLMRCRAGLSPGSYASAPFESSGSGTDSPSRGESSSGSTPWERGAASVADLNVSKRSGMVNSVTRNWQPPAQQQAAEGSLAQDTALADPFADAELKGNGPDSSGAANTSGSGAMSVETSSDDFAAITAKATDAGQSTDPLATGSVAANRETSLTDDLPSPPSPPSQAEIPAAPNTTNAAEASTSPVAQVADASNWSQFASTPSSTFSAATATNSTAASDTTPPPDTADKQIDDVLSRLGKSQPENSLSVSAFGPLLHQENKLLNDFDAASGALFDPNAPPGSGAAAFNRVQSDLEGLGPALATGVGQAIKEKIQDNVVNVFWGDNPGYQFSKKAKALSQDISDRIQDLQNLKSSIPDIQNLFKFKPKCGLFETRECMQ